MAIDVSRVLDTPQLAAARVTPRGRYWRQVSRGSYNPLAALVLPLTARIVLGPKPELGGAQTPEFGCAILAVTSDELVLVEYTVRKPTRVIGRVRLADVETFDLQHARLVWPLTITFRSGDSWRLEVPLFFRRAAKKVAAAVTGQLQPDQRTSRPATSS
jgi:hypothetical protein